MANNIDITPGTGKTVATDELSGSSHAQLIKLAISTAGSATLIPAEATNGLDVDVTRIQGGNVAAGDADSGNPVKVGGKYNASAVTLTDGDRGDLQLTVNGFTKVELASSLGSVVNSVEADNVGVTPFRRADAFQATLNSADASGSDTAIKTATASKRHYISDLIISSGATRTVTFKDGATIVGQPLYMVTNQTVGIAFNTPWMGSVNTAFNVRTSGAGNISVWANGYTV